MRTLFLPVLTAVRKKGCCWYQFPSVQRAFIKKTKPTKKKKKRQPNLLRARLTNERIYSCPSLQQKQDCQERLSVWWTVTDANSQAHANWCPMDISIQKQRFLLDNLPEQLLALLPQEGFLQCCASLPRKRLQALLGADF